jgi:3-hydroxyisobutyrate dehydrogenase-like beta-hydroxyacid dehydrogenase
MKIGFIGLGAMGKGMAACLLRGGHQVTVWNRSPGPAREMQALGAQVAESPRAAFQGDALVSMLPDDPTIREVFITNELFMPGESSTVHINMATISVAFADEFAAFHRAAGVPYISAPVFGRSNIAAAGKLNILAAGDPIVIEKVRPALEAMSQRIWMLGALPRQANAVKICGNFMVGSAIEAMSEAVALGRASGVEAKDLLEIVTTVLFDTPVYKGYGKIIADKEFEPAGFKTTLGLKDIGLALLASETGNVPLPLASLMRDNLLDAIAHGGADKDWAVMSEVALRRAKLDKRSR